MSRKKTISRPPKPPGGLDPAAYEKIDELCERLVERGHTPGIVLLIGRGEETLMRKAYGNRMTEPHAEPMTVDTLFDVASLTKPVCTAPAIMLLAQQGRISVDAPVARYVPEFGAGDKKDITIAQLLTHTSGLPAYTSAAELEKEYGPRPQPDGLIRGISRLPKAYETGNGCIYSCLNYLALARVVKNVTGLNQAVFLREHLWRRLGMKDTTFFPTPTQIARTAPTVYSDGAVRRGEVHDPLAYYSVCPAYAPGNAGAFTTVDDMQKHVRLLLGGGRLGPTRIFLRKTCERMTADQSGPVGSNRTFGWGVAADEAYCTPLNNTPSACCLIHTGYTGTLVWIDKLSRTYVVFFSNCVYPRVEDPHKSAVIQARRRIVSAVLDHLDIYRDARPREKRVG
ncbi:MAG TPA: serine hydrolase domain-containing protein [Sumerlaeia bacterium]|nr:serine hydrolase domain-containing protein [Sumerlaeia bacterium]